MTILRRGDVGAEVRELQRLLRLRGASLDLSAEYEDSTLAAVRSAQERYGLVVDGVAGPKTLFALQVNGKQPTHLGMADLRRAADELAVPLAAVRAVNEVESRGTGFLADGRPVILFERHIMYRQLRSARLDADGLARQFPNVVNPVRGGYVGGTGEHMRLAAAWRLDSACALASASWGLFQVMGYHWELLGFASVEDFADAMRLNEAAQLDAFVRFILADPALHRALKASQWGTFARFYNGPAYKENLYDVKLARAFARYQLDEKEAA
ncbi:N-acetylmuramidase domain-containing protein [Cupriavidus pinatubonensis]|uniref:N-acetylmuramidase domain-containing protein n=1 Tax=Cupriavidus pinatubonensis TaxID=248026 RepID=UPI00112EFAC0|nr:N-acetylmuramidase domain-containing protein [Cupriavidus pinatubonensis]TPQ33423.1 peptidoglycan-binding protein [Cupriavidus pinatubonensis]